MAETALEPGQQTFDVSLKVITLHLTGTPAVVAGAATSTGVVGLGSYAVYNVVNHKKFVQTVLKVFERWGTVVADVASESMVITVVADSEKVAEQLEHGCTSFKLLDEINEKITRYNEETWDTVQEFKDITIHKTSSITVPADQWKSTKEKFKQNVEVFEKGIKPYEDATIFKIFESSLIETNVCQNDDPKQQDLTASKQRGLTENTPDSPQKLSNYNVSAQAVYIGDFGNPPHVVGYEELQGLHRRIDMLEQKLDQSKEQERRSDRKSVEEKYQDENILLQRIANEVKTMLDKLKKVQLQNDAAVFGRNALLPTETEPLLKAAPTQEHTSGQPDNTQESLLKKIQDMEMVYDELAEKFFSAQYSQQKQSFPHKEEAKWLVDESTDRNEIYYCTDSSGNNLFIKKIMYKSKHGNTSKFQSFLKRCKRETNTLRLLSGNPYILNYITHEESEKHFEIVTELCNGNVFEYVKCLSLRCQGKSSNEWPKLLPKVAEIPELRKFATNSDQDFLSLFDISPMELAMQMIEGINVLHSLNFAHQDIKPQNFLLKKWGTQTHVKVCDFGISKKLSDSRSSSVRGTPSWMPPELLLEEKPNLNLKSDIFSLGLVLFYTLTNGKHPYGTLSFDQDSKICHGEDPELGCLFKDAKLSAEERINACDLMYWMLQHKPENRPSCAEIKCHPMLSTYKDKVEFLMNVHTIILQYEAGNYTENQHSPPQRQSDAVVVGGTSSSTQRAPLPRSVIGEMVQLLKFYPAWLMDGINPKEMRMLEFDINGTTLRKLRQIINVDEQHSRCASVKDILSIMKKTRKDSDQLSFETREKLGLGLNKDWKKFYNLFTEDNPQILARAYQVFKRYPGLLKIQTD